MKIKLTKKLIPLLQELRAAERRFAQLTELLQPGADRQGRDALDIGAERETVRNQILDIARRIDLQN